MKSKLWTLLIIGIPLLILMGGCASGGMVSADPTALPYTPVVIEPLEIARGDAKAGEGVYTQYCASCHSIEEAVELAGPTFFEAGSRLQFKYIKNSIVNPHEDKSNPDSLEFMPEEVGEQIEPEQLYDVIAYIRTLK